jgi:hypothetical protein
MNWRTHVVKCVRLAALAALIALSGCGSSEDNTPLVRVTGVVLHNGKPMPNARVSFVPAPDNKHSTPGVDQTGPDGNYTVKYKGRFGVATGKYKVVIEAPPELPASAKVPEAFKDDPVMGRMSAGVGVPGAERKSAAATQKKEGAKSEFDAVVEATTSTLDFEVKD